MRALEGLRTFRGSGSLTAWIMGIAAQKRLQDSRGNRRELPTDAVLYYQNSGLSTDLTAMQRVEIETISHALKQISPDCAEALTLYFFGNLTSSEVSQVLKKNPAAIEQLIGRGIQELRTRTSLATNRQKEQNSIDPTSEEDALVEKLANTASRITLDPLFISELEQALVARHQPKTKWKLPLQLQQFISVGGWVALMALGIFLLNWRVTPKSSAVHSTKVPSQTPIATKVKASTVVSNLIIKTAKPTATRTPTLEYIVQAGDNCTYIAERYGVTIDELITLNHLNSACDLWVDQKLVIPIMVTATP
jgi:RNA polymerase sigma factor (sigma-70 family)